VYIKKVRHLYPIIFFISSYIIMFGIIASALAPLIVDKLSKLEKGGDVKKTGAVIVHKGEYMLPKGVKPTKAQRKAVAKGKAKKTAPKKTAPKKKGGKKGKKGKPDFV
jgi:hypothetical protein